MNPIIRRTLVILNVFLAITAIGGGIGLLIGFGAPPLELSKDKSFHNCSIPGLALLVLDLILILKEKNFFF
jgi:hypothetical protein